MRNKLIVLAFSAALLLPAAARADVSLAVVDVQKVLTESAAARSIQDEVKTYRAKFVEEISKQEADLRAQEKKISDESATLSKEDLQKKKQDFETRFMETSRMAQNKKKNLDAALTKAMTQLRDKFTAVVQELAKEKGYTMVISTQVVVAGEGTPDVTADAMARLDKAISKISLDVAK